MPSFYPRHNMPRQLPLTPPEFVPNYHTSCGGMPYQQPAYAGQPAIRQHDDGLDFADRYGQLSIAVPPAYSQAAGTYLGAAPPSLPPPGSFFEPIGAPILPPMRMQGGHLMAESALQHQQHLHRQHQHQHQHQRAQELGQQRASLPPHDEKPVGGVSAKLDYDMEVMTDFVCEMALQVITPGRMMPPSFRKWIHQVLCATRLPSATVLLSMFYLSSRMPMLAGQAKNDSHLYRLLTIALVLGSKFLDDNTFINRSWSEVSGIPVADLNQLEMEWLVAIEFKLHRDPSESQGWDSWSEHWKDYQSHAAARAGRPARPSPIDTSVQRQQSKPLPPSLPVPHAYNPPPYEYTPKSALPAFHGNAAYAQYDPWRSAIDRSPASAPTTGPTTPEYYGAAAGAWAPAEGYSRRTMFGFPPLSQPAASQPQHSANHDPPAYSAMPYSNATGWNSHPVHCNCLYCAQRHPPYFLAPGFGPQAVAG